MVMKFLKAYMVDIGEFLSQTGYLPADLEPVGESKRLPVISWAQAGNWQQISDTSQYGDYGEYVETDAKGIFALRVRGESMEARAGLPQTPQAQTIGLDDDDQCKEQPECTADPIRFFHFFYSPKGSVPYCVHFAV